MHPKEERNLVMKLSIELMIFLKSMQGTLNAISYTALHWCQTSRKQNNLIPYLFKL